MAALDSYGRRISYGQDRTACGPINRQTFMLGGQGPATGRRKRRQDLLGREMAFDAPLGLWMLDEWSGTTADDFVGTRTATYRNSPTFKANGLPHRTGVTLNGSNQVADTADQTAFGVPVSGTWTIELWLKYTTSGTSIQTPMSWRGTGAVVDDETTLITVNNGVSGRIQVNVVNAAGSGRVTINSDGGWNDGKWHHVVATAVSGGVMTLYVDGVSRGTDSSGRYNNGIGARRVAMGANIASTTTFSQFFAGSVAAAAIYSTALSASRVKAHYLAMA